MTIKLTNLPTPWCCEFMKSNTDEASLRYSDWLHLSYHLLWAYDEERNLNDAGKNPRHDARKRRVIDNYSNNAAWLVRRGWIEVEHNGQILRAEPGQWLIVKPTQRVQRLSDEIHILSVGFDAKWPDGRPILDKGLSCIFNAEDFPKLETEALKIVRVMKRIAPEAWNAKDHVTTFKNHILVQARLSGWLQTLIDTLAANEIFPDLLHNHDERVVRAIRILESQPLYESTKLDDLARTVGMSKSYFASSFKAYTGKTPANFRNDLRLDYAKRVLAVPHCRIKEVASDLGFNHLSQFSRWFKRYAGIAPRNYVSEKK